MSGKSDAIAIPVRPGELLAAGMSIVQVWHVFVY